MASTLFSLPSPNEGCHGLEDLIQSSHFSFDKVVVINFQKPMIPFIFFDCPMASPKVFRRNSALIFLGTFFRVLFSFRSAFTTLGVFTGFYFLFSRILTLIRFLFPFLLIEKVIDKAFFVFTIKLQSSYFFLLHLVYIINVRNFNAFKILTGIDSGDRIPLIFGRE